jgi:HK97 family phage portal protein
MKLFDIFKRESVGVPSSTAQAAAAPKSGDWRGTVITPIGRRSLLVPAWFRGVSLIMQTMGQMLVQYQRMNGEGGNFIEDRYGSGRALNYLLQVRPNPLMTASQMQEQVEYRKIYFGNAYVYIERDINGWPRNLWLCTGGGYDPIANTYSLTYNKVGGATVLASAPAEDVLHFKNTFLTDDYYMGEPTVRYAMKTLSIAATADDQTLKDMAKHGYILYINGKRAKLNELTDAEVKKAWCV